jgi:6-phosphogluconolactonase
MARETLLSKVPLPPANIHGIRTGELSAEEAAARYADEIRGFFHLQGDELPEFDLVLLGLGDDGHTASLFPNSPALHAEDKLIFIANPVEKLNTTRLTLTVGTINAAHHVVFLVTGTAKADILATVFEGQLRPDDYPSQRIHPESGSLVVMADRAAAAKLTVPDQQE